MAATAALVTAAALLVVSVWPAVAFVQLMGNNDVYCESEGSYCRGDSGCCAGLECVPRFSRIGGGVCQRREGQRAEADDASAADHSPHRYPSAAAAAASGSQPCQSDSDCSAGQCCARRSAGPRGGGGVSACSSDCSDTEVSNILADFYTRYYRRSLRDRAPAAGKHGAAHKHRRHGDTGSDSDSKKKKKKNL